MVLEKIIDEHLNTYMSVPVFSELPKSKPETFVRFERTSGSNTNKIDSGTIAIQSYATSLYGAITLNEEVKTVMGTITARGDVSACKLENDYNFTDTKTRQYRYQAVFSITYYK